MNSEERSNEEIREDLRRAASTATGFCHDAAMRFADYLESRLGAALARIAAVEARAADVDLIRRAIADPGQFVSRARWSADPGFAGESIASWSARAVVAVLAASPTPTGPDEETPHHYSRGYPISDAEHAWDVAGDVPCPDCGGSGNGSTLDGRDLGVCPRCGGDGLAATREPTEETPQ